MAKVVTVALAALVVLQPLAAMAACFEPCAPSPPPCCPVNGSPADEHSAPGSGTTPPVSVTCCQISSPKPAPAGAVLKSREAPRGLAVAFAPVAVGPVRVAAEAARVEFRPGHAPSSSLHALYCVFLI